MTRIAGPLSLKSKVTYQIQWIGEHWNRFWFTPSAGQSLATTRLCVCGAAALWFAMLTMNSQWWFGSDGWNADELARVLSVQGEGKWSARFRVTPLWATSHPGVFQLWAGTGIIFSVCAATGLGGRAMLAGLFLCSLLLAQRLSWSTGTFEPALIAALGYLLIDPGRSWLRPRAEQPQRWTATLATRLIQVHTWLLCAAALASQAAHATWWRGEAAWWLAETGHSNVLTSDMLHGRILLVNALTHAITLAAFIAVSTLLSPRFRWAGLVSGFVLAAGYALVADQTLYGILLAALLTSAFRDRWQAP